MRTSWLLLLGSIAAASGCRAIAGYGSAQSVDAAHDQTHDPKADLSFDHAVDVSHDLPPPAPWPETRAAWAYRRPLQVQPVGAALADFPLFVSLRGSNVVGPLAGSEEKELLFADALGTPLAHEIVHYDQETGELSAWVRTNLAKAGTRLYLYYGAQPDADLVFHAWGAVWSAGYAGVWHFDAAPPWAVNRVVAQSYLQDSGGMGQGNVAPGVMDGAWRFDGVDDFVEDSLEDASFKPSGAFTLSIFFKLEEDPALVDSDELISTMGPQGDRGFDLSLDDGGDGKARGRFRVSDTGADPESTAWDAAVIERDRWVQLVGVFDPGRSLTLYLDGVRVSQLPTSMTSAHASSRPLTIGSMARDPSPAPRAFFGGSIDEARISSVARSPAWVQASYFNQSNPSVFVAVGGEEPRP